MTPLESSVSDATLRSVHLESSSTILEASLSLIYDVYSNSITCDDSIDDHMFIVQAGIVAVS